MEILSYIAAVYFFVVFFLARFFVPHLGFRREGLPAVLPEGMEEEIQRLKRESAGSSRRFIQLSYELIGRKYCTGRLSTLVKIHMFFLPLDQAWSRTGFLSCTLTNEIMRIFLLKSGYFAPTDVRKRVAVFKLFIHQYMQVRSDGRWIDVDVGEYNRGLKIGEHLGF